MIWSHTCPPLALALLVGATLTSAAADRAPLDLSAVPHKLVVPGDTDPLAAPQVDPQRPVSAEKLDDDLPGPGAYYHFRVMPDSGGYPGIDIAFDEPVDFSGHDVLSIWLRWSEPTSFFRVAINGADGVIQDQGIGYAATYRAAKETGVWHRVFIPYKIEPGWVRFGEQMDHSRIASITFYTDGSALEVQGKPCYDYAVGGMTLHTMQGAQADFRANLRLPEVHTAKLLHEGEAVRVWSIDPTEKVFRETTLRPDAPRTDAARASAAGHEYASLLLALKPERDLAGIRLSASDLRSAAASIRSANITLRYVDDIEGLMMDYPDPLPLVEGKELHAAAGELTQVWATIYVPEGTPAGLYRGGITLQAAGDVTIALPVAVEVYDFSLPRKTHLKTRYTVQHLYGGREWFAERSERYWGRHIEPFSDDYVTVLNNIIRDFGEHRITPELFGDFAYLSFEDQVELARQYHFDPLFSIGNNIVHNYTGQWNGGQPPDAARMQELREHWRSAAEKLRDAGVAEISCVKIGDEPAPGDMEYIELAAREVKAAAPYIQRFLTINTPQLPRNLYGHVDVWCPQWTLFDFAGEEALERKAAGDHFWTYAAEYAANTAYEPLDLRTPYWLYWRYGITGVHYSHHIHACFLTYPNDTYQHSDGLRDIPSIRWEMIRHGMQDYEYFHLLRALIERAGSEGEPFRELLTVPDAVARSKTDYGPDPRPLAAHRELMARAIEALTRR